jgi:hypothetical protein
MSDKVVGKQSEITNLAVLIEVNNKVYQVLVKDDLRKIIIDTIVNVNGSIAVLEEPVSNVSFGEKEDK